MLNFLIMVMWYLFSKSKIYFCRFRLEQKKKISGYHEVRQVFLFVKNGTYLIICQFEIEFSKVLFISDKHTIYFEKPHCPNKYTVYKYLLPLLLGRIKCVFSNGFRQSKLGIYYLLCIGKKNALFQILAGSCVQSNVLRRKE